MSMKDTVIPHLEEIEQIRHIETQIYQDSDIFVNNISHWNAGKKYQELILSHYHAPTPINPSDYHYSYEYDYNIKKTIISKFLSSTNTHSAVFVHNATAAICCIADYLKKNNYKKICVVEPAYFSIYSCLSSFGLNVYKESITIENKETIFPFEKIIQQKYDCIWLTSPIFSTGIYYTNKQIEYINALSEKGIFVIIDESASSPNQILSEQLSFTENMIAIFSPHKYLSINAVKFAVIICSYSMSTYFENWIDVFIGALPLSSCIAIEHFLSPNFEVCLKLHDDFINKNLENINSLCLQYPDNFYYGKTSNYISICNKHLPYAQSLDQINMYQVMRDTHVSFVPGYINGFNESWGFCYRVNLTLNSSVIQNGLGRLFNYFYC